MTGRETANDLGERAVSHELKRFSGILLWTGILLASPAGLADDRPRGGAYEVTTTTTYTDVPLPDTTVTTVSCLSDEDLERDPASALAALPDGQSCAVEEFVMEGGVIRMRIVCDTTNGSLVMVTSGSYDADAWDLVSDVTVAVGKDRVKMHSTIEGRRTGDC